MTIDDPNSNKNVGKIKSFRDLDAWKEGHKLVLIIYEKTKKLPREETFGLTSQMRRAAVSVTSNIAEGFSRNTNKDKYQFYCVAQGSLVELYNQVIVVWDIGYINGEDFYLAESQIQKVGRIITGLKRSVV